MTERKFGRKTPNPERFARSILFSHILKAVPTHPISQDYLASLSNWQMLGNDQYGDCVAVGWANMRRFLTAELTKEHYPSMADVIKIYKTQNPGFPSQDDGMDISVLLSYLIKNGGSDGVKPLAFAKVDFTNLEEVKAAMYIFGGLLLGVNVQSQNINDFDSGKPWQYRASDYVEGGHCVLAGGYLGKSADDVQFITWAEETGFTDKFWNNLTEEAWVVVWPENIGTKQFVDGIDLAALAADFKALTGNDLPVIVPPPAPVPVPPTPTPVPVPVPTPTPAPIPQTLVQILLAALKALITWLESL